MSRYRRLRIPGATYYFTVRLADPGSDLLTARIEALRASYAKTMQELPFFTEAIVILPNHMHAVWTLPMGDDRYSERWRRIKARFLRGSEIRALRKPSNAFKRERGLWQRRFWEHTIRDRADFDLHVAYCWNDPVQHGLSPTAADWPYSSFQRDMRRGSVSSNWRTSAITGQFGE